MKRRESPLKHKPVHFVCRETGWKERILKNTVLEKYLRDPFLVVFKASQRTKRHIWGGLTFKKTPTSPLVLLFVA